MRLAEDLLVPLGPGRVCLVTPQASPEIALIYLYVGIVRVSLTRTVTPFASQGLVLELEQLLDLVRVTFVASLSAGENRFSGAQFRQRCAPIPTILLEGWWSEEVAGDGIRRHDPDRQQKQ